ncbi:MAG: hypothetical protein ACK4XJ_02325 [Fimbriimonadaceae bacterium]
MNAVRAILLVLMLGFLAIAIESRSEHRYLLEERREAWIPVYSSIVLAGACLMGFARKKALTALAAVLFALGIGVGALGLFYHTQFKPLAFQRLFDGVGSYQSPETDEPGFNESAPALAPLGLVGLSTVGFIVVVGLRRGK